MTLIFTVVIADDDKIICEGIKSLLKEMCPKLEIKGAFFNGNTLFDFVKSNSADIYILDIQMPGKSGLDIVEYIQSNNKKAQFILVTGHFIFEYAKKAINNHVYKFITKPYDPDDLLQALDEIVKKFENEIEEMKSDTRKYIAAFSFTKSLISNALHSQYNNYELFSDVKCLSGTKDIFNARMVLIQLKTDKKTDIYQNLSFACDFDSPYLSAYLISKLQTCDNSNCYTLCVLYESEMALQSYLTDIKKTFNNNNLECEISDIQRYSDMECHRLSVITKDVCNCIINKLPINMEAINAINPLYIPEFCKYLKKYLLEYGYENIDCENIKDSVSLKTFIEMLTTTIEKQYTSNNIVVMVKSYIDENYKNSELTLESISKHFFISPNYLGKIFTEKIGKHFSDYLVSVRIKASQTLLTQTDTSIAQICTQVGFNSENYFRKRFKAVTGVTPANYRLKNLCISK